MPLDDADKKFITDLIAESAKAAQDAAKRESTSAVKGLKLEDTVASIVAKALEAQATAAKGAQGDTTAKGDAQPNVELLKTQEQLKALSSQLAAQQKRADEAEQASKTEKLINGAREALVKAGVPADRVKHALAVIHAAEGRLKYDDKGQPGMHFTREGYDEVVPLDKGIGEWIKTDDGKVYLPPVDARGPADARGAGGRPSTLLHEVGGKKVLDMEGLAAKLQSSLRGR